MSRIRLRAGLAGALALTAALLPGIAAAEVPSEQVPDDLKAIIEQHIESKGHDYAGLCREVNEQTPLPVGKHCAFVLSIEHDIAEVTYGPVASNDLTFVSFLHEDGAWKLRTDSEPYEPPTQPSGGSSSPTPRPPSTGGGNDPASGDGSMPIAALIALGTAALAGAGAATIAVRK